MPVCQECGLNNAEGARFCNGCAAPLEQAGNGREQRRTVTVLFCDVTGSTALGEASDPEAFRSLLARYFDRMSAIVAAHGGTVGKFIGDAVMAVFGMPVAHEDDALRACRSAIEMRDALPELGLEARIGINTGEAVSGIHGSLATGDAVNVAARLEQAAQPGEILVGAETLALVDDVAEVEALEPLELKGKSKPVRAYRLTAITGDSERRHETPFVGRNAELQALRQAWQRVLDERRSELVTVLGDAGVGKSRLTMELLSSVDARVVRGRCVPYGEGITYWPVVEVLKQLGDLPSDPAAAGPLRSLLRETEQGTSAEEIAWAFSRVLEEQAPLVVVFDDIHWGEETFLDLIDAVAVLSSVSPLLLLCLARPELAERRPEWPVAFRLKPLPDEDVGELLPETLPEELRRKITRAAGGNPLYVTEMVAMASDGDEDVVVPPNLQALMAARLDQLPSAERSVLELGAVEGEIFHRGTVQALSDESRITPHLASLVRRELIRPEKTTVPGDDAFRFRHLLIRDATYEALPKATRAEVHQRFAELLEKRGGLPAEQDEIVGYHLERAARCKQELGQPDAELARRAGDRLAAAGRRALARGDSRAARGLLARSLELTRELRLEIELELDLCECEYLRSPETAAAIAESAAEHAERLGDRAGEAIARVVAADYRSHVTVESRVKEVEELALRAVPLLEEMEDDAGLARAWGALGGIANLKGRHEEALRAAEKVLLHSRRAGRPRTALLLLEYALAYGPCPADEALLMLDESLPGTLHPGPLLHRSLLLAMLGRFHEAWLTARESSGRAKALTGNSQTQFLGQIATMHGDHATAVEYWRDHCQVLEQHGDRAALSTAAPLLGRSLCAIGRFDEAEPLARLGRELGDPSDIVTQTLWRQVQACVLAAGGEDGAARALAAEAVGLAERTDALNMQGDALSDLAGVLAAAGRSGEAATALEQALQRYERKKNVALVEQTRLSLESLGERLPG